MVLNTGAWEVGQCTQCVALHAAQLSALDLASLRGYSMATDAWAGASTNTSLNGEARVDVKAYSEGGGNTTEVRRVLNNLRDVALDWHDKRKRKRSQAEIRDEIMLWAARAEAMSV
eukprot:1916610-Amphidinium_carterae.1